MRALIEGVHRVYAVAALEVLEAAEIKSIRYKAADRDHVRNNLIPMDLNFQERVQGMESVYSPATPG